MKKIITILTAVVLVISASTSVFAHGRGNRSVRYSVCPIEDCAETALHIHDGNAYLSHFYGDEHNHDYCAIEDCILTGYHSHDGVYCFGHTIYDGHDYHEFCYVNNCTQAGYHEHQGTYCFARTTNSGNSFLPAGCCRR